MKKVSILYGWAEGHRIGKNLRNELHENGFSLTKNSESADIIIAHSGGIFLIPKTNKPQLVLLVGLPYWPGQHPTRSLRQKILTDLNNNTSSKSFIRKTFYNTFYFIFRPIHHLKIYRMWKRELYPEDATNNFIAIRNQQDSFMHPEESINLAAKKIGNYFP